jgi:VWFA-related protein
LSIRRSLTVLALNAMLCVVSAHSQQQNLPDAPAPKLPAGSSGPLPGAAPLPPNAGVPAQQAPPQPDTVDLTNGGAAGQQTPMVPPRTVKDEEDLKTFIVQVRLVLVPATVKDRSGHLVQGLQQNDFSIYENGAKQDIRYFSSEPFPLSVALVIDTGLPETTLSRIKSTLRALGGAFGPYDEAAIFTYGGTVAQRSGFVPVSNVQFSTAVTDVQKIRGAGNSGVPITGGPLQSGPTVNNHPVDPNTNPRTVNSPSAIRDARVMNDAILAAAQALVQRGRARRKVIMVISDGHEYRSRTSYSDVLKVLLDDEIMVDGIAVDTAAIGLLDKIERIHVPTQGYGDLLPKYASATGGTVYRELTRGALEQAYQQATFEARNQYTLGYSPKGPGSGGQEHQIEVRVKRRDVLVYARDGYYALPSAR